MTGDATSAAPFRPRLLVCLFQVMSPALQFIVLNCFGWFKMFSRVLLICVACFCSRMFLCPGPVSAGIASASSLSGAHNEQVRLRTGYTVYGC